MTTVSQAEFARLMSVSRKSVTQWKKEGRIVMVDGLVDVERSRELMLKYAGSYSKRLAGARALSVTSPAKLPSAVTPAVYADAARAAPTYDPADLPDVAINAATAIGSGAADMALILAHHMPMDAIRTAVDAWVEKQRAGWVGGPGLPESIAEVDGWPMPPAGYGCWSEVPLFTRPPLDEAEWREVVAEAKAGGAA